MGPDPLPEQPDRFSYLHNFWKHLNKLMISLGYTEYVTQGGDWGHTVRRYAFLTLLLLRLTDAIPCLANVRHDIAVWSPTCQGIPQQFPSVKILSPHHRCYSDLSPTISARPISFWRTPVRYVKYLVTPYTQREREGLAFQTAFREKGYGYLALQSTRPQTLGYNLADSPVGLLAWIYEKLVQ